MIFKINFKSQITALKSAVIFTIVGIFAFLLVGYSNGFIIDLVVFFSILYLPMIGIVIFLHIQYYLVNKDAVISFDTIGKTLLYNSKGNRLEIEFSKIKRIEFHMVPSVYHNRIIQITPFESYYYAVLFTDSERITITNILIPNLSLIFDQIDFGVKPVRIKKLFPNIQDY